MKKGIFLFIGILLISSLSAQDIEYARKVLNKLSSKGFYGRGYVKNGDRIAADYIVQQFEKHNVHSFETGYLQYYHFPINTFPEKILLKIDEKMLVPGDDYVVSSSAGSIDGQFPLLFLPDTINSAESVQLYLKSHEVADSILVVNGDVKKLYGTSLPGIKGVIVLTDKTPWWHVSNGGKVESTVWMKIRKERVPENASVLDVRLNNSFVPAYNTQNVIGFVKGKKHPDRYIAYTAHYDHLGMMGNKAYFPGANDNGSGTAMLIDLARHYALPENRPDYSLVFMAFSGEEAGLKGSTYYAENPLFPLESIQLLINLDMVGSGSEGIAIVNGKAYKELFDEMVAINEKNNYLLEIKDRGETCNSDHCPFYQKGVKSVFIYTRGKEHMEYHTVNDVDDHFPFTAYDGLFKLLTSYVSQLN